MNVENARLILGVTNDITEAELKKKYHMLMNITHPDVADSHDYPYAANEINEAYEFLAGHIKTDEARKKKKEEKCIRWNAPINPNAYAEREIYQYYEDQDGIKVGTVTVDTGKYIWIPEEDFPLFLKSLYNLSKKIIADDDETKGLSRAEDIQLMGDLTYLLAGQFFGAENAVSLMKNTPQNKDVYYTAAMLELLPGYTDKNDKEHSVPGPGDYLVPAAVRNHRLYVKDKDGKLAGYLTFRDDRLLFGIVPLFERKAVQIKAQVTSAAKRGSVDVDLWLKLIPEEATAMLESINLKIRELLDSCR